MKTVITGASRGIGLAIAQALAAQGHALFLISRSLTDLQLLKSKLHADFPTLEIYVRSANLANAFEAIQCAEAIKNIWPQLEVLVNNVGNYETGTSSQTDAAQIKRMMDINFYAHFHLTQQLNPHFNPLKSYIFHISSIAVRESKPEAMAYTLSKKMAHAYFDMLRSEAVVKNQRICQILPGSVNTSSWDGIDVSREKMIQPEDIANLLLQCLKLSEGTVPEEIILRPSERGL